MGIQLKTFTGVILAIGLLLTILLTWVYFNKAKAYLTFIVLITQTNDKRNDPVLPINSFDMGVLVNFNEADSSISVDEGFMIGSPEYELNWPRRLAFKFLNFYTNSIFAPPSERTPVDRITYEIRELWSQAFAGRMDYPVFPYGEDDTASGIFVNSLKNVPLNDYVKRAIRDSKMNNLDEVVLDFSYLSQFDTSDKEPVGAKIYFKNVHYTHRSDGSIDVHDWDIDRIYTDRFGMDTKVSEKSYAIAARALLIDLSWYQHLFLCHLYGSSLLASDIISSLPPDSRYRRLFAPFFLDSRSLLFDEVGFLTNDPNGEILRITGFTYKGLIAFIHYCLNKYNLDDEYHEALYLHPEYIHLLENHFNNIVGNHNDLHIKLSKTFKGTKMNSTRIMTTFLYIVSVKHKIFGTSVLNLLPYLNLHVDEKGNIYRTDLVYTLSTAYGTFYNFKAMLKDNFDYLAETDEELTAMMKFRVNLYELDREQRRVDPNNPNQCYATELDTSCMR